MKREKSSHYKIVNGEWVEKRSFDTESEAIETACFYNAKQNLPYKMVAYKCDLCGKWHIGKNGKRLFDGERKKYSQKFKIMNLVKKMKNKK